MSTDWNPIIVAVAGAIGLLTPAILGYLAVVTANLRVDVGKHAIESNMGREKINERIDGLTVVVAAKVPPIDTVPIVVQAKKE